MSLIIAQYCWDLYGTCTRYILTTVWSLFLVCISIYSMFRTFSIRGKITYEFAPLTACALQALLNAVEYSIYNDNHLVLIQSYSSVITFAFLGQSFPNLYYRLTIEDYDQFKKFYRKVLGICISFYTIMFVLHVIQNINATSRECSRFFFGAILTNTIQLTVTACITTIYGIRLLKIIDEIKIQQLQKKNEENSQAKKVLDDERSQLFGTQQSIKLSYINKEATIIVEKQQQIRTVCYGISITTILYIIGFLLQYFFYESTTVCNYIIDRDQIFWKKMIENVMLGLISFIQITPCLYIPYVFYYIPVSRGVSDITKSKVEDIVIKDYKDGDFSMQPHEPFLQSDDLFIKNAQNRLSKQ